MRERSAAIYRDVCLKWHGVIDNHREEVYKAYPSSDPLTTYPLCRMSSSSAASPSLTGRLVTACTTGDLPSVRAAVADGASVNEPGSVEGVYDAVLPLTAAVERKHHDVVVWLLSHGADPNGDKVLYYTATASTPAILQLLIDAGGRPGHRKRAVQRDRRTSEQRLESVLRQTSTGIKMSFARC